jgi:hypothetical protein
MPPSLLSPTEIAHVLGMIPSAAWIVFGVAFVAWVAYKRVFKTIGILGTIGVLMLVGAGGIGFFKVHHILVAWQKSATQPSQATGVVHVTNTARSSGITDPLSSAIAQPGVNLNAMNPLAHQNSWLLAAIITIGLIWAVLYFVYRLTPPQKRAEMLYRLQGDGTNGSKSKSRKKGDYELTDIEVGIRKEDGRAILLSGEDRFLHTLVVGSTGTGKTSRILTKGVYQDIQKIAEGNAMDVIVLDPDGGFGESALGFAEQMGVHSDIIDLRGTKGQASTLSFNPFSGGDIADIVDNVRAVLKEQMGEQDPFFQNAQDDLVRTVIQVLVPLWPETDFVQFADLVTDPLHFRSVCAMVYEHAMSMPNASSNVKKKKSEEEALTSLWEKERPYIEESYDRMEPHFRSMVLSASRSFLMDTRTEQKLEHLEKVTKGLKIVVNELATNERMRQVLRRGSLPMFDFASFFDADKTQPGRLLVVITGNRPFGKLFGKLFLVTMKIYALARNGTEWTRRPVYLYSDEFSVYGTESFVEAFSQIRKYRVAMTLAIQARSQLLDVSKMFLEVVEGNCRNKIIFPAPSANDAKFFEDALGSITEVKATKMENRLNWFWFDNRRMDRRISTREEDSARFKIEDIAYGLRSNEAIFALTSGNQALVPFVGITSMATEWAAKRKRAVKRTNRQTSFNWRKQLAQITKMHITFPAGNPPDQRPHVESRTEVVGEELQMAAVGIESTSSEDTSITVFEPKVKAEQKSTGPPKRTYLRPSAKLDDVIPVSALVGPVAASPTDDVSNDHDIQSESGDVSSSKQPEPVADIRQTAVTIAEGIKSSGSETVVHRSKLRRRTEGEQDSAEKLCPRCRSTNLVLTVDERKWYCTTCGFDRKNR